ncbi:MAG: RimK/LysX family protein [Lentisphaerales bacterium]|nr:RimK/LysX family protein [Lentisphaerales bacterium]
MKWAPMVGLLFLLACQTPMKKATIGETAYINIAELKLDYLTRIDTGATITSIHATNVKVKDGSKDKKDNVGKRVSFDTINHKNKKKSYSAKIVDISKISNSQGTEYRYEVELTLEWHGISKKVVVNLRDRSKMTYKLLVGRNWLKDDFVVDVNLKAQQK